MASVFTTARRTTGADPRTFVMGDSSYTVSLDDDGNPKGVTWFAGPAPTFLGAARMAAICSPAFIKAAEDAATRTLAGVKAGTLVRKPNKKGNMSWQLA